MYLRIIKYIFYLFAKKNKNKLINAILIEEAALKVKVCFECLSRIRYECITD